MVNYFYDINGIYETVCPTEMGDAYCRQIDAEDSDPTVFYMLAYHYYKKTNDASWFKQPDVRLKLEGLARLVYERLYFSDPYWLTNAKRTYAVMYTMDNSEVYAGMLAFLNIEQEIYASEPVTEHTSIAIAGANEMLAIKEAIFRHKMYPDPSLTYATGDLNYNSYKIFGNPLDCCSGYLNAESMYQFTPATWPPIFGVDTDFNSAPASYMRTMIDKSMSGWYKEDWYLSAASTGFWGTSVGYYFCMSSNSDDRSKAKEQAQYASASGFKPYSTDGASLISDAGWLLMTLGMINNNIDPATPGAADRYTLYKY